MAQNKETAYYVTSEVIPLDNISNLFLIYWILTSSTALTEPTHV